jgi:hypothetical protein
MRNCKSEGENACARCKGDGMCAGIGQEIDLVQWRGEEVVRRADTLRHV